LGRGAALLLALAPLLATGCGTPVRELPVEPAPEDGLCCTRGSDALTIQYLGVGGWLFRMGETALLTAPFYSHPGTVEVGFWRISMDTARVDSLLPPVDDVRAILVGHAHYDHLMDVPYIARVRAPDAESTEAGRR